MDIKPIRNEFDYRQALDEIERLFDAEPGTHEYDRLEVLVTLVEAYEREHYPIPHPDPIEAIEYWIESRGLSRSDLIPYIGSRNRVSEILNRKRPLTLRMIRNLEEGLGIPAEILVQDYPLAENLEEVESGTWGSQARNLVSYYWDSDSISHMDDLIEQFREVSVALLGQYHNKYQELLIQTIAALNISKDIGKQAISDETGANFSRSTSGIFSQTVVKHREEGKRLSVDFFDRTSGSLEERVQ